MIKLMTIFCMAGILTVNPAIIGLAEEESAVGAEPVAEEEEPAAEADTAQTYKYTIYYNDEKTSLGGAGTATDKTITLSLPNGYIRDGYEFLGFFK